MNKIKNIAAAAIAVGALGLTSCGDDFLKEEQTTRRDLSYFDTPEGIRDVADGLPTILRLKHSYEYSYTQTNYGTDEFTLGSDPSNEMWNNYSAGLKSVVSGSSGNRMQPIMTWDMCYVAINNQNTVIAKAPTQLEGEADLNAVLGAAYFFRGWTYLFLVEQWGGVPLKLAPSTELEREFTRATLEASIQQAIDDLQQAYDLLGNDNIRTGAASKDAAAHFLAKALLHRQSEICSEFRDKTKDADLAKALQLCDEVIAQRPLADNFADLCDFSAIDGPNEQLPEVIIAAQYTVPTAGGGANGSYGNQMNMYYISLYQNWAGMNRDRAGGREYARLRTTDYAMDVYDRRNDSRFWKSFRTKQRLNIATKKAGWLTEAHTFEVGQLGVLWIINDKAEADRFQVSNTAVAGSTTGKQPVQVLQKNGSTYDTIKCPTTSRIIPNVLPRYRVDTFGAVTKGYPTSALESVWPSLSKYLDGNRTGYGTSAGYRDGIIARVAETYLIAAEVKVRQGQYGEAITKYIQPLRNRAAYKGGEDRAKYVDGGQAYKEPYEANRPTSFWPQNSYYESTGLAETTDAAALAAGSPSALPAEDEAIIAKLGVAGDFDRMLCFVLNERSRELMGELVRWADLSRTKTLVKRTLTYNEDAILSATLQDFHLLRPIPQEFLDGIWKGGRPLTADEKQAMQNTGY